MNDRNERVALALGSNLGDRRAYLQAAVDRLGRLMTVTAVSPVYETAPWGFVDQADFLNLALVGTTALPPAELLAGTQAIERAVGRRPTFRNGPRVVDIDLIYVGQQVIDRPDLQIPHPRMASRRFVLQPLADVAAEWVHPVLGQTTAELLAALPDDEHDAVRWFDDNTTITVKEAINKR